MYQHNGESIFTKKRYRHQNQRYDCCRSVDKIANRDEPYWWHTQPNNSSDNKCNAETAKADTITTINRLAEQFEKYFSNFSRCA